MKQGKIPYKSKALDYKRKIKESKEGLNLEFSYFRSVGLAYKNKISNDTILVYEERYHLK